MRMSGATTRLKSLKMTRRVIIQYNQNSEGKPDRPERVHTGVEDVVLDGDGNWVHVVGQGWSVLLPTWEIESIFERDE